MVHLSGWTPLGGLRADESGAPARRGDLDYVDRMNDFLLLFTCSFSTGYLQCARNCAKHQCALLSKTDVTPVLGKLSIS